MSTAETAEAIWWDVATEVVKARGEFGTATFYVSGAHRGGEVGLTRFKHVDGRVWDTDDANPRRRAYNTMTLTEARKCVTDMVRAVEARVVESDEVYKNDPSMQEIYHEAGEARSVAAIKKVQAYLAKYPSPADWLAQGQGTELASLISDAATADGESVEVNPWVGRARERRVHMEDWRARAALRDARILFVLFGQVSS
jgi:hypothetical protein